MISGTAQVTGLNPQNASTTVTFAFQTRANANAGWQNLNLTATLTSNGVNGTANFNSPWLPMGPPGQGAQYQTVVSGFYFDGNGNKVVLPAVDSPPITPNP